MAEKTLVPFSYNEIYQGISKKFLENGYDIPFEGSNTAILTSILSYLGQAINLNTALNINENVLTLAKKRKNVVNNARILSYEAKHRISTQLNINLKVKKEGFFNLKKYQEFEVNGYKYYYFGNEIQKLFNSSDIGTLLPITIKEGTLVKYEDYPDVLVYSLNEKYQYIDIPFDDIEDNGLFVKVDTFDDTGNIVSKVEYTKKEFNLIDTADTFKNVYFRKDDLESGNARIYFKIGNYGVTLKEGSTIYVDLLRSSGAETISTNYQDANVIGDLAQLVDIVKTGADAPKISVYGKDEEDIENIKENAPLFYNTAGRCITEYDYKAFLGTSNAILEGSVKGGEDELSPLVGRVLYTCIPNTNEPDFEVQSFNESFQTIQTYNKDAVFESFDILRKVNYNQNLFLKDGDLIGDTGIIQRIEKYSAPGLISYVRNPVYVFADIDLSIKKYSNNLTKIETQKKVFEVIKEYFDARKGFNVDFVESTLIKRISNSLGDENGFNISSLFSIYLDNENITKNISKNFDYNTNIILYETQEDISNFIFKLNLNSMCLEGDTIKIKTNRNIKYLQEETNLIEYTIKTSDLISSYINIPCEKVQTLNIKVEWKSSNQVSSVIGKEVPLNLTTNYYTCEIRNSVVNINVLLTPTQKVGDSYDLYFEKNGLLSKITQDKEYFLTNSDINAGEINVTFIDKLKYLDEIESPDSVIIKFKTRENGELVYCNAVKCDTIEECKNRLEQDKLGIYDNLDTSEFFVTSVLDSKNAYNITMYLPTYFKAQDTITFSGVGVNATYQLTETDIKNKRVTYNLQIQPIEILTFDYNSKADYLMNIFKKESFDASKLIIESDDRIQTSNLGALENTIPYTPSSTNDKKIKFKDNFSVNFYRNQRNKLDIRNLILNYGLLDELTQEGKNSNIELSVDFVTSSDKIIGNYEFPYLTCETPSLLGTITLVINMETFGKDSSFQFKELQIPIKETTLDTTSINEGLGGIYFNLEFPPEGIYDENGNINISKIPTFFTFLIEKDGELYNPIKLHTNPKTIDIKTDKLKGLLYIDFGKETDKLPSIYPYFVNEESLAPDNTYKWLRFPIYYETPETKEIIGTFIILNNSNPSIRVKLRNNIINLISDCEFELNYPSGNFTLSNNMVLRLRSVTFNQDSKNAEFRKKTKLERTPDESTIGDFSNFYDL